jgi:hypothetical protein
MTRRCFLAAGGQLKAGIFSDIHKTMPGSCHSIVPNFIEIVAIG